MPEQDQGDEEATCGTGLAAASELPRLLASVIAGLEGVLQHHLTALDPQDEASKPEYDAYASLVRRNQHVAQQLRELAVEMAGYRELPLANHDMEALMQPRMRQTFEAFVRAKQDLRHLLEAGDQEDQEMLKQIPDSQ